MRSPPQRVDRGMAVVFPGAPFVQPPPLLVRTPAWSLLGASVVAAPMVFPNGLHLFSFLEPQSYPRRCTLCQEGGWGVGADGSSSTRARLYLPVDTMAVCLQTKYRTK